MWMRKRREPGKNKPIQSFIAGKPLAVAEDGDGGGSSAGADGDTIADGGGDKPVPGAGVSSSSEHNRKQAF